MPRKVGKAGVRKYRSVGGGGRGHCNQQTSGGAIAVDWEAMQTTISGIHLYFNMAERPIVNPPAKTLPASTFPPMPGSAGRRCVSRSLPTRRSRSDRACAPALQLPYDGPFDATDQP